MCYLGLRNGDLNEGFLIQQLNNPQINQRDREILVTVLGHVNPVAGVVPQTENMSHPVMSNNVSVFFLF